MCPLLRCTTTTQTVHEHGETTHSDWKESRKRTAWEISRGLNVNVVIEYPEPKAIDLEIQAEIPARQLGN